MTVRLAALMSLVLALCLATFAFMTRRYHQEVMEELPRTVAQAGRAAIRSLEPGLLDVGFPAPADRNPFEHDVETADRARTIRVEVASGWSSSVDADTLEELRAAREALAELRMRTVEVRGGVETVFECDGEDCLTWSFGTGADTQTHVIRLDAIHAEADPAEGMVLRIPTVRRMFVSDGAGESRPIEVVAETEERVVLDPAEPPDRALPDAIAEAATAIPVAFAAGGNRFVGQDIVLPIGTDDYQELYDRFRNKSLLLLAGVFAVGLALTGGLATRFTRPVRRLDVALREISEGNLDVRVPVHGRDELARLGRAFNEMTGKLREGRDRAHELTRREKLSALGRLAAGVAHDVRNPLHSIALTLDHLRETSRPEAPEAAGDFDRSIEIIRDEIRRLDGLVSSFLRFAATGGRERTRVSLGTMLDEITRLVRKEAEWRGVEVETAIEGDDPTIDADVESIRAALLNLVLNAFEAMPEGGTLALHVRREGDEAVIEVRDTGVGIPEDERDRVFDFAYSTRDGGSGLGLAIVHQCVVEDHGGRIALDSEVGRGTTITLRLPDAGPDDPAGAPEVPA